jgi:DNA-directed RNA polymerase subunit RPC12/RpoP
MASFTVICNKCGSKNVEVGASIHNTADFYCNGCGYTEQDPELTTESYPLGHKLWKPTLGLKGDSNGRSVIYGHNGWEYDDGSLVEVE